MNFPKREEIYLISLNPVIGSEIGKSRPGLIISNNRNNEFADTVMIIPITSKTSKPPFTYTRSQFNKITTSM